jgi:hypothetical protein
VRLLPPAGRAPPSSLSESDEEESELSSEESSIEAFGGW